MSTVIFAEMMDNVQHQTRLIPGSRGWAQEDADFFKWNMRIPKNWIFRIPLSLYFIIFSFLGRRVNIGLEGCEYKRFRKLSEPTKDKYEI
jgi:hypothetical protein